MLVRPYLLKYGSRNQEKQLAKLSSKEKEKYRHPDEENAFRESSTLPAGAKRRIKQKYREAKIAAGDFQELPDSDEELEQLLRGIQPNPVPSRIR